MTLGDDSQKYNAVIRYFVEVENLSLDVAKKLAVLYDEYKYQGKHSEFIETYGLDLSIIKDLEDYLKEAK